MTRSNLKQVVLASSNKGKIAELQGALEPLGYDVVPQSEFNCTDAIEDGLSFVENAIKKARHAAQQTGLSAIADDSGLEVVALNGAPGIHSARFAGEHGNDAANNAKLIESMQNKSNRTARFRCALVMVSHTEDPAPVIAEGIWSGEILDAPRGENGFGYDPLFWLPERKVSSAELSPAEKKQYSHRAQALLVLKSKLEALES